MKLNFKKSLVNFIYLLISTLIIVTTYFYSNYAPSYQSWISVVAFILLTQLLINLIFLSQRGVSIVSLSSIFVVFTFLFHFGQVLLIGLFPNYDFENYSLFQSHSIETQKTSILFSMAVMSAVVFGMLFNNNTYTKQNNILVNEQRVFMQCKYTGIIIFLITFPYYFYYEISKLRVAFSSGYSGVLNTEFGVSGVLVLLSNFYIVGLVLILIAYRRKKLLVNVVLLMFIIFNMVLMFNGARGQYVINIVLMLYIYNEFIAKVSIKTFFIMFLSAFFGLTLLNTIFVIRKYTGFDLTLIITEFKNQLINNPFLSTLEEFGSTMHTVQLTIEKMGESLAYSKGATYFESILTILPNVGGVLNDVIQTSRFGVMLNTPYIGGSYIGELYYNFGYLAVVFAPIIGFIVNFISNKFKEIKQSKQYLRIVFFIIPFIEILWWIRDYFTTVVRSSVWGAILFCLIILVSNSFFIKNKKLQKNLNEQITLSN